MVLLKVLFNSLLALFLYFQCTTDVINHKDFNILTKHSHKYGANCRYRYIDTDINPFLEINISIDIDAPIVYM